MTTYIQTSREKRRYVQTVIGDTIVSAIWRTTPGGPTLTGQSADSLTSNSIMVTKLSSSTTYVLSVTILGASGQIYEGKATIVCDS